MSELEGMNGVHLLLGGSFNPVHHGHLSVLSTLVPQLTPQRVSCIPCGQPVHRNDLIASHHRLNMLTLALEETPYIVEPFEILRAEPSYAWDTLQHLKALNPNETLIWVIGADQDLSTWHRWPDLLSLAHFICINRSDAPLRVPSDLTPYHRHDLADLHRLSHGGYFIWQHQALAISASPIRRTLMQLGHSADLNPKVMAYIKQHRLYGVTC